MQNMYISKKLQQMCIYHRQYFCLPVTNACSKVGDKWRVGITMSKIKASPRDKKLPNSTQSMTG